MCGITDSMDMNLSRFQEMVKDKVDWCAAVHGESLVLASPTGPAEHQRLRSKAKVSLLYFCVNQEDVCLPGLEDFPCLSWGQAAVSSGAGVQGKEKPMCFDHFLPHLTHCTESGWVLCLLKSPTNTPEPASQSLH